MNRKRDKFDEKDSQFQPLTKKKIIGLIISGLIKFVLSILFMFFIIFIIWEYVRLNIIG